MMNNFQGQRQLLFLLFWAAFSLRGEMARRSRKISVTPGFKFTPSDRDLVNHHLRRKLEKNSKPEELCLIPEHNHYQVEPWDLISQYNALSASESVDSVCFFFCASHSGRQKRRTPEGSWHETSKIRKVTGADGQEYLKRFFTFYHGRRQKDSWNTHWHMHEFTHHSNKDFALCKIFKEPEKQGKKDGSDSCLTKSTTSIVSSGFQNYNAESPEASVHMAAESRIQTPLSDANLTDEDPISPQQQPTAVEERASQPNDVLANSPQFLDFNNSQYNQSLYSKNTFADGYSKECNGLLYPPSPTYGSFSTDALVKFMHHGAKEISPEAPSRSTMEEPPPSIYQFLSSNSPPCPTISGYSHPMPMFIGGMSSSTNSTFISNLPSSQISYSVTDLGSMTVPPLDGLQRRNPEVLVQSFQDSRTPNQQVNIGLQNGILYLPQQDAPIEGNFHNIGPDFYGVNSYGYNGETVLDQDATEISDQLMNFASSSDIVTTAQQSQEPMEGLLQYAGNPSGSCEGSFDSPAWHFPETTMKLTQLLAKELPAENLSPEYMYQLTLLQLMQMDEISPQINSTTPEGYSDELSAILYPANRTSEKGNPTMSTGSEVQQTLHQEFQQQPVLQSTSPTRSWDFPSPYNDLYSSQSQHI